MSGGGAEAVCWAEQAPADGGIWGPRQEFQVCGSIDFGGGGTGDRGGPPAPSSE